MRRLADQPIFCLWHRAMDFIEPVGERLGLVPRDVLGHRLGVQLAARLVQLSG